MAKALLRELKTVAIIQISMNVKNGIIEKRKLLAHIVHQRNSQNTSEEEVNYDGNIRSKALPIRPN